ncbi:MAG: VTT domain-containing protein [Nitrospirae bacterium]|nr:VTT domain-containing protein [Nitrospirota bacterium]
MSRASVIDTFTEGCISCDICKTACPFLSKYGAPDKIIFEAQENVFYCTNCNACTHICPQKLSPSEAFLEKKYQLIKSGLISDGVKDKVNSARKFADKGHRFPFSYYSVSDTVFWPGCALAGMSPQIVKRIVNLLTRHLNKKLGIALDCCFDPLYQIGDINSVKAASERIRERLKKHKINHIITGCANCQKIFSLFMPEIKVEHILEILPVSDLQINRFTDSPVFLHHPCPAYRFEEIRNKAKEQLRVYASEIKESAIPSCCGLGGGINAISKKLSEEFTDKAVRKSDHSPINSFANSAIPIVTYCMGCKNRFLENGKKAYHLLEFISGIKPLEKPVSSGKKWINRFSLSMSRRLNKKLLLSIAVVFLIIISTYLRRHGYFSAESILGFIQQYRFSAPLLFILLYSIGPSLFIPSLPLTLGAGFLWGPFWGVLFSITGATIGASIAFLLSRYIMGDTIKERFNYSQWQWLEERVEKHGWKAVAFTRIVPIFPFPVLNYLFGITPITFFCYLWSTFIFMLPACIAYVAFGSSMGELILKGNMKGIILGILIASAALVLPIAFKPMIKRLFPARDE